MKNITIGRIVEFFPNGSKEMELPNNMKTAPAIVTQVFDGSYMVNMTVFCAEPEAKLTGMFRAWSVRQKSDDAPDGVPYWDWFKTV